MRISFAEFTLDRKTRQLLRGQEELHLEPKAFELLDLLLARRPEAISKGDIQAQLWPDTFVSEASLTGLVAQIRQALGDHPRGSRFVRTVHGFGYAFCGEAAPEASHARRAPRPPPWVIWDERVMHLQPGENVLGRGGEAALRIDAPGVSRRHARILVGEGEVMLEDLGSKNGTYLRGQRLAAPALLADGDEFRLGRQQLVYHGPQPDGATVTERDD